jgi:hypothetical protein
MDAWMEFADNAVLLEQWWQLVSSACYR